MPPRDHPVATTPGPHFCGGAVAPPSVGHRAVGLWPLGLFPLFSPGFREEKSPAAGRGRGRGAASAQPPPLTGCGRLPSAMPCAQPGAIDGPDMKPATAEAAVVAALGENGEQGKGSSCSPPQPPSSAVVAAAVAQGDGDDEALPPAPDTLATPLCVWLRRPHVLAAIGAALFAAVAVRLCQLADRLSGVTHYHSAPAPVPAPASPWHQRWSEVVANAEARRLEVPLELAPPTLQPLPARELLLDEEADNLLRLSWVDR
jgi:hypothetical protein